MTSGNWLLSIIPTVLLLLLAWFARHQYGSWLSPTAFFGAYWGLMLLAPLIIAPDYYFWPGAAWFIFFCVWTFHIGMQLGWALGTQSITRATSDEPAGYYLRWGRQILVLCCVFSLPATPIILQSRGYSLSIWLNPNAIMQIAREFSVARYTENYAPPLAARLLTTLAYVGAMWSGVWLAISRTNKSRLLALLPFVPVGLQSLITTTRANLLFPMTFCIAGYCAVMVLQRKPIKVTFSMVAIRFSLFIVIVLSVFIGLQILRDKLTIDTADIASDKAMVYILGAPSIFSEWLEHEWMKTREPTGGAFIVAGIFDLLNITNREQGIFVEYAQVGTNRWTSNIYTIFRGMVEDFTVMGVFSIFFIAGLVIGFAYRRVLSGDISWVSPLVLYYAFALCSGVTSILNYNTNVLAWVIFSIALAPFGLFLLRPNSYSDKSVTKPLPVKEQFR